MISTPAGTSMSLEEAAAFLGVHPNTLQQMAASGAVHSLIPTPALDSLLSSVEHPELDKAVA